MKTRIVIVSAAVAATLALGGCHKTETTNVSANDTAAMGENLSDMNDAATNSADNASNGGDPMKGDETHP